jgi:hypothetical protein
MGDVEAPIPEIRSARVGGPGPNKEENDGCDNNVACSSLVTFVIPGWVAAIDPGAS